MSKLDIFLSNVSKTVSHRSLGPTPRRFIAMILALVFLGFMAIEYVCMSGNCAVVDEVAHIPAGVSHWERGLFSLYQENPPLVRCLVSLPVWLSSPRTNYSHEEIRVGRRTEWLVGGDFVRANSGRYFVLLFRARCVSMLFGVASGILISIWTRELFGARAAIANAALWLMDPGVLAHSGLATLDVGCTFFGLMATYLFWKYLRAPSWLGAGLSGLTLGLALASKFSMLSLLPAWAVMAGIDMTGRSSDVRSMPRFHRLWMGTAHFVIIPTLALAILNGCYGFEGTFGHLENYRFTSFLLGGGPRAGESEASTIPSGSNRFEGSVIGSLPVPLPAPYLQGFDSQKHDEEKKLLRLTEGRLVHGGNFLGPFVTLAMKLPPGTLILLVALGGSILLRYRSGDSREAVMAATPGLFLLGMLATQTGLNWALRYSLPALPYLLVATGAFVKAAWVSRLGRSFVLLCLAWNAFEVLTVAPHYLSYANVLVGGTDRGHRHLLGSNYDWGQDLLRLKRWIDEHPDARPMVFACYNAIEPWEIGLGVTGLPVGPPGFGRRAGADKPFQPYYLAISTNIIHGVPTPILQDEGAILHRRLTCRSGWDGVEPAVRLTPSILIFHIREDSQDIFIDSQEILPDRGATP